MKKLIICTLLMFFGFQSFAAKNFGGFDLTAWETLLLLIYFLFLLVFPINFLSCIDNIKRKSKKIRTWNIFLSFTSVIITYIAFNISSIYGFIGALALLLQGIFIYFSLPKQAE